MIEFFLFFALLALLVGSGITALVCGSVRILRRLRLARQTAQQSQEMRHAFESRQIEN